MKEKTKPGKSSSFQENIKFLLNLTSIAFLIVNTQLNPPNEEMQQFSELGMGSLWKKMKALFLSKAVEKKTSEIILRDTSSTHPWKMERNFRK